MKRWGVLIAVCVAIAAVAIYLNSTQSPEFLTVPRNGAAVERDDVPPEKRRLIERLKSFDAAAYARSAIAKGDFRHVRADKVWQSSNTPGIFCVADLVEPRTIFLSDSISSGDVELWEGQVRAAERFNPALVADPKYPDQDVCIVPVRPMTVTDAIETTRDQARRPNVVDLPTAVRAQDFDAVTRFIAAGADIDASDRWQSTPLMWAIRRKNQPIFDALIAAGAQIHKAGGVGAFPLTVATETGDAALLRMVLTAGAQPTRGNPKPNGWRGSTNIHVGLVIELNRVDLLELLLEFEAVPEREDSGAWDYPLGMAVKKSCIPCVEKILAFGGSELAGSGAVFKLIIEELDRTPQRDILMPFARASLPGIGYSPNARDALRAAIDNNHRGALKYLLLNGQNVNFLTPDESRALAAASAANDDQAMKALIATSSTRRGAIDAAIQRNDTGTLRRLISKGALEQDHTLTPLMLAAKVGTRETIRVLVELGGNIEARIGHKSSNGGYREAETDDATPLYLAIGAANLSTARALLDEGANLNATVGWRPLLSDVGGLLRDQNDETWSRFVDLLIEKTPTQRRQATADKLLNSAVPLSGTVSASRLQKVLDHGADSCAPGLYDSALAKAASGGSFETYELLLKHCRRWKSDESLQKYVLAKALDALTFEFDSTSEQEKIALDLLGRRVPLPDDFKQRSYLCDFARRGSLKLIEALVAAGANINAIEYDRTALDCVRNDKASAPIHAKLRQMGAKTAAELGYKPKEPPFPF